MNDSSTKSREEQNLLSNPSDRSSDHLLNSLFCFLVSATMFCVLCVLRTGADSLHLQPAIVFMGFLNLLLFLPSLLTRAFVGRLRTNALAICDFEAILLSLLLLVTGLAGYLLGWDVGAMLAICGYAVMLVATFVFLRQSREIFGLGQFFKSAFAIFLLAITAGVWFACDLFSDKYHNALFLESLLVGLSSIDTLYHAALLNMIENYNAVSIGINGLDKINYHFGSHWLYAQWCKILGQDGIKFYMFGYGLVVLPLFLKVVLTFATQVQHRVMSRWAAGATEQAPAYASLRRIAVVSFSLMGFFTIELGRACGLWYTYIGAESYSLSLILLFLLAGLSMPFLHLIKTPPPKALSSGVIQGCLFLGMSLLALACVLTKVSVAFVLLLMVGYAALRFSIWKKPFYLAALAVLAAAAYCLFQAYKAPYQVGVIPFNFYLRYLNAASIPFHLLLFYSWTILIAVWQLGRRDYSSLLSGLRSGALVPFECCLVFSIICTIPGILLAFPAGEIITFMEPQYWLAASVFAGIFASGSFYPPVDRLSLLTRPGIVVLIMIAMLVPVVDVASRAWRYNQSIRRSISVALKEALSGSGAEKGLPLSNANEQVSSNSVSISRDLKVLPTYPMLAKLSELNAMSRAEKKRYLLFIPQNIETYWSLLKEDLASPFIAPALSGMALIDGLPKFGTAPSIYYGYYYFDYGKRLSKDQDESGAQASFMAAIKGFRKIFYVRDNRFDLIEMVYSPEKRVN